MVRPELERILKGGVYHIELKSCHMELKSCKDDFAEIALTNQEARDIGALVSLSRKISIMNYMVLSDEDLSRLEQKFLELKNKDPKNMNINIYDFGKLTLIISKMMGRGGNTMLANVEKEAALAIDDKLSDMHAQIFGYDRHADFE